uniref:GIPC PDZ domain containing family member 1 n=1 Tax=Podarcis muralis TaxID=64176 RepID=A0A670K5D3_PODMU
MPLGLGRRKKAPPLVENEEPGLPPPPASLRPRLVFHTQLAHGSPTGRIEGFTNVKELYSKIAEAFKISPAELSIIKLRIGACLYCHIVCYLISGHNVFLRWEVSGNGRVCICILTVPICCWQRIKEGSVIDRIQVINVGDMIESINGQSLIGCRHYEVAKMLKDLPKGRTFTLKLTEPRKAFDMISQRSAGGKHSGSAQLGTGRGTLRLRAKGPATVEEQPSAFEEKAIEKVDDLLESYMGIRDTELAATMVELGKDKRNPDEFAESLDEQLGDFAFPDEFVFDVWGAIGDAKVGRY